MGGQWVNGWFVKTISGYEAEGDYVEISSEEYAALFANHLEGYEKDRLHGERKVEIWLKEHCGFVYYVMELVKKAGGGTMMMVPAAEWGPSFMRAKGLSAGSTVGFCWDPQGFLIFHVGYSFI
ncbi:unnamed protein product [Linum trigynum]|uniref:Uncharacterized protein n=1 Tax=Linum trigynum TaxID=586398 RepID=A0AAV2DYK7_9ROSI